MVAGSGKLHVQEGGFGRVPATHLKKTTICVPTLLTVLFICATGIMITIAPRSQAATPQSPTVPQLKQSPAVFSRSRERFRQVSGLSAPRPLNERFVRRGRLLAAARERVLAFSSAPSAASPSVTRYPRFSNFNPRLVGHAVRSVYSFLHSNVVHRESGQLQLCSVHRQRVVAVATRHGPGEDEASRRRGASRTRPALSPAHPRADPTRDIPADRHSPVAPFLLLMPKETLRLPSPPASRSGPHAGCAGRASPRAQGARRRGGRCGEGAGSPRGA